jgi:spoIIIJ-associated protein
VAHAEASARTVEAAVTAAAAQLGLPSDQVDVEVLEEPVPSTFGYIGSPARVRVTPRQPAQPSPGVPQGDAREAAQASPPDGPGVAPPPPPSDTTRVADSAQPSEVQGVAVPTDPDLAPGSVGPTDQGQPPSSAQAGGSGQAVGSAERGGSGQAAGSAEAGGSGRVPGSTELAGSGQISDSAQASGLGQPDLAQAMPPRASGPADAPALAPAQASAPAQAADLTHASDHPMAAGTPGAGSAAPVPTAQNQTQGSEYPNASEPSNGPPSAPAPDRSAPDLIRESTSTASSSVEAPAHLAPAASQAPPPVAPSSPAAGMDASEHTVGAVVPGDSDPTRPEAGRASFDQSLTRAPSSSTPADEDRGSGPDGSAAVPPAAAASAIERTPPEPPRSERSDAARARRAHRDEPIDPEMVEADTERAGDFLEGLLDALDVDGDITTWIDEVGGHIELEGSDLSVLVGSNGETLDALQELTRIAVLRQSKRRVRLLLDINGFRSRQRNELIAVVKAIAERVIRSREEHEFEPMTPAERKIVHDAVAAIDGVQTESLGEEPYRRVVIRPT